MTAKNGELKRGATVRLYEHPALDFAADGSAVAPIGTATLVKRMEANAFVDKPGYEVWLVTTSGNDEPQLKIVHPRHVAES